jgi:DNA-binding PadR family transcriptional regulator
MTKILTDKQMQAKKENEQERERKPSGFLLKQRAFLKLYMITMTDQKRLYGLSLLTELRREFDIYGYKPNSSEIYKSLHDLLEDGILEQVKKKKEGMDLQEVVYYRFKNKQQAEGYKSRLKEELERCSRLIDKALADNFGQTSKAKKQAK